MTTIHKGLLKSVSSCIGHVGTVVEKLKWLARTVQVSEIIRASGGIGIHAAFRAPWAQALEGSNPSLPT